MDVLVVTGLALDAPMAHSAEAVTGLCKSLLSAGHQVCLLTTHASPDHAELSIRRVDDEGLPVILVTRTTPIGPTAGYRDQELVARFLQIVDVVKPDVVHFHSLRGVGVDVVEAAQRQGLRTVVSMHDAWWFCQRESMIRSDGRWCGQTAIDPRVCGTCVENRLEHEARQQRSRDILNACDHVLVPSPFWRSLVTGSGVSADRVSIVVPGVGLPATASGAAARTGPLRLGFVGGYRPERGYRLLEQALREIVRSDYELHIVDPDDEGDRVPLPPEGFDLPGYIRIVPRLTPARVDEFLDTVDVLVCPTPGPESNDALARRAFVRGVWPVVPSLGTVCQAFVDRVNASVIEVDGTSAPLTQAVNWLLDNRPLVRGRPTREPLTTTTDAATEVERYLSAAVAGPGTSG